MAGVPPNGGRTILPIIGSARKRRAAEVKDAMTKGTTIQKLKETLRDLRSVGRSTTEGRHGLDR
jgi:hypothetical protein